MGVAINIQIVSANNVGGVYPFVVVCFDGDISNELYKTDATTGGQQATWNHTFSLDLTSNVKALVADGRPEPTYITFFLFDTGTPGVPSLGSAGVLLATVRDHGRAQGDFPVVNGSGTLRLVVTSEKTKTGRFGLGGGNPEDKPTGAGKAAKIAGVVGAGALAAGLAGLAVHQVNKKKNPEDQKKKKKKGTAGTGTREINLGGSSSSSDDDDGGGNDGANSTVQVQNPSSHAWWDDSASDEGNREVENGGGGQPDVHVHVGQDVHYGEPHVPQEYAQHEEQPDIHVHVEQDVHHEEPHILQEYAQHEEEHAEDYGGDDGGDEADYGGDDE